MRYFLLALLFVFFAVNELHAFPWDSDMYKQPSLKANEVGRAPVPGTVPVGHTPFLLTPDEAEKSLKNPVRFSARSVFRGRRLWGVNCTPCHGDSGDGKSTVGPKMSVPSLLDDFYKNRGDGRVFAVIHHGGASMPRYGYKLSAKEKWDIVNYLRFLQGKEAAGVPRPKKR